MIPVTTGQGNSRICLIVKLILTRKKPELVGSGLRMNCQEDYRFILRRIAPTAPINPVPSSNRELGSGVVPPPP